MEATTDIIICTMLLHILFASWNGLVILWYTTHDEMWRDWWHRVGVAVRFFIVLTVWLGTYSILWTVVSVLVAGIVYNVIINAIIGKPLLYVGTTSYLDKLIRKLFKRWF